jgi:hypothetical protein
MRPVRISIIALWVTFCVAVDFDQLQAYIKASNTGLADRFASVSLSEDGNTLAVGAHQEDSAAVGVDGNQTDNSSLNSGAVYVFVRVGSTWSQQAYLKASHTRDGDVFGWVTDLSADGNTLVVGANGDSSNSTGINNPHLPATATNSGAVYVFVRAENATWSQQAYIKASNADAGDLFGYVISLSSSGDSLAVGAFGERSIFAMDPLDNSQMSSGAAYVFIRSAQSISTPAILRWYIPQKRHSTLLLGVVIHACHQKR